MAKVKVEHVGDGFVTVEHVDGISGILIASLFYEDDNNCYRIYLVNNLECECEEIQAWIDHEIMGFDIYNENEDPILDDEDVSEGLKSQLRYNTELSLGQVLKIAVDYRKEKSNS